MLSNLIINNFALIKNLEIQFNNKLNVVSGETGSGKSLIMRALKFVLGDRADKSYIRNGQSMTKVQCVFDDVKSDIINLCNESGIDISNDDSLIISRTLNIDGKSDIRINGTICTLTILNQITEKLVDFYGQQEHYSLLNINKQMDIVDNFRKEEIENLKSQLSNLITEKKEIVKILNSNYSNEFEKEHKLELLNYEIQELENNSFEDDYELELLSKKTRYQSMDKIRNSLENIQGILDLGYSNSTISNAFKEITSSLKSIEKYDDSISEIVASSDNIRYEIEDFNYKISKLNDLINIENINIDELESELDLVKNIKKKYGLTKLLRDEYLKNAKDELFFITNNDKVIAECNEKLSKITNNIITVCDKLFKERELSINEIEKGINQNLKDLGMKNSEFKITHILNDDVEKVTTNGLDSIEFLFTSNLGQPLKPLKKIISGGELSRFMLAYKNVVMLKDDVDLLIFDEIDSGISGNIGQMVANKIADISNISQIISISHLPQIVSMADHNYLVYKEEVENETYTKVKEIDGNDLLKEIARLSGSKEIKELDLNYAQELKTYSNNYKNNK